MDAAATEASRKCERCGSSAPSEARFCAVCGASLDSNPGLREERKLVSILFVDLDGWFELHPLLWLCAVGTAIATVAWMIVRLVF